MIALSGRRVRAVFEATELLEVPDISIFSAVGSSAVGSLVGILPLSAVDACFGVSSFEIVLSGK